MDSQDKNEILGSGGLNPLRIPDVIRTVLESRRLSVDDLKTCRLVCTDWSTHAKNVLSHKSRITIKCGLEMKKFAETFTSGEDIPSQDFKLFDNSSDEMFMTDFSPLFDWPGLEIQSLILNNCSGYASPNGHNPYVRSRIGKFLEAVSTLLKRTGNLKHLAFQYWTFNFEFYENLNDLKEVIENGSKIKSLSLNNCKMSDAAALVLLPTFNTVFPELESIDFSNLDDDDYIDYRFCTNILPTTLVRSFTWSNIKTLRIPELNTEVIDGLNRTDMKLKHFHADKLWIWKTSIVAWTEFLSQQNELQSFSIKTLYTEGCGLGPIGYRIPRMKKLRRLHIGGNGIRCLIERSQIFETCPNLNELIVGSLPADMVLTNQQITSLTLENEDIWYCDWLGELTSISKKYVGLKHLTFKLNDSRYINYVKKSLSNIFPDLLEVKVQ